MTFQYIDGINDLYLQDGTIRGTLVVLESQFEPPTAVLPEDAAPVVPTKTVVPVGTIMTSLRGLLQIHAAIGQLVDKLVEANVLQRTAQQGTLVNENIPESAAALQVKDKKKSH